MLQTHLIFSGPALFSGTTALDSSAGLTGSLDSPLLVSAWLLWAELLCWLGGRSATSSSTWERRNAEPVTESPKNREGGGLKPTKTGVTVIKTQDIPDWKEPIWAGGGEEEVKAEEEWGGTGRRRAAERAGVSGSQRASRSGLDNRGTGVMSAVGEGPDGGHAPWTPEENEH